MKMMLGNGPWSTPNTMEEIFHKNALLSHEVEFSRGRKIALLSGIWGEQLAEGKSEVFLHNHLLSSAPLKKGKIQDTMWGGAILFPQDFSLSAGISQNFFLAWKKRKNMLEALGQKCKNALQG